MFSWSSYNWDWLYYLIRCRWITNVSHVRRTEPIGCEYEWWNIHVFEAYICRSFLCFLFFLLSFCSCIVSNWCCCHCCFCCYWCVLSRSNQETTVAQLLTIHAYNHTFRIRWIRKKITNKLMIVLLLPRNKPAMMCVLKRCTHTHIYIHDLWVCIMYIWIKFINCYVFMFTDGCFKHWHFYCWK